MVDRVKIQSFEDLDSWKNALQLSVNIYKVSRSFPREELYGLTSQIRRASSSISANIAEGFGRYNKKEKAQFYKIAYGSLLETKSFLYLCNKLEYVNHDTLKELLVDILVLQKQINSIVTAVKER